MFKKKRNILFIIFLIVVLTIVAFLTNFFRIPPPVLIEYQKMKKAYDGSLGAKIMLCKNTNNNKKIFVVSGNGGFSGFSVLFSEYGKKLGSSVFNDYPLSKSECKGEIIDGGFGCLSLIDNSSNIEYGNCVEITPMKGK